jgi:hypothetical protein
MREIARTFARSSNQFLLPFKQLVEVINKWGNLGGKLTVHARRLAAAHPRELRANTGQRTQAKAGLKPRAQRQRNADHGKSDNDLPLK